jgi:hypothetical protein
MLVDGLPYAVSEVVVPGELVFILDRTDAPPIDIN